MSPRLVKDMLAWTAPQLVSMFADQDPSAVTASVSWAGPKPVPVWLDQLRDVSEFWIHRQQILQALGDTSDLRADLAGPVLDGLRWAYPYRLGTVSAEDGDTVVIEVTGPVEKSWCLVAGSSGWQYRDQSGSRLLARMNLATEDFWRLLTNNLSPERQIVLDISGELSTVEVLRTTRAIIGIPK